MMAKQLLGELASIDYLRPTFVQSLLLMLFNPLFWNLAGRAEYRTRLLTRLTGGRRRLACYLLAVTIFSLGILRDFLYAAKAKITGGGEIDDGDGSYRFARAIRDQGRAEWLCQGFLLGSVLPVLLIGVGQILVLSSAWRLGIIGTFLGDYFGFLMKAPITAFPYNVCEHPMYQGATLIFLGYSLW